MKWLALHVGGQKWGVYVVQGTSRLLKSETGAQLSGCCYYDKCRIYISKDQDEQAFEDTLIHELLHASLEVSGAGHVLAVYEDPTAAEEQLVRSLTPVLHRLLKDLGLRLPKRD